MPEYLVVVSLCEKANPDVKFTSRRIVTYGTIIDAWRPLSDVVESMPMTKPKPTSDDAT